MTLSDEQVQAFIECWKKDFGEVLTPEEARAEAMRLLDFFVLFAEGLTLRHGSPEEDPDSPTTT